MMKKADLRCLIKELKIAFLLPCECTDEYLTFITLGSMSSKERVPYLVNAARAPLSNNGYTFMMRQFDYLNKKLGFEDEETIYSFLAASAKDFTPLPYSGGRKLSLTFDMSKEEETELYDALRPLSDEEVVSYLKSIVLPYETEQDGQALVKVAAEDFLRRLINDYHTAGKTSTVDAKVALLTKTRKIMALSEIE